jgi:predicted ATPase
MPYAPGDPAYRRAFVGREQELGLLTKALDQAIDGRGGLAMVAGEPGIGKTALCEELARLDGERGALVLVGHCYEEGALNPPYSAFVEALRAYVRQADPQELRAEVAEAGAALARILPDLSDQVPVAPGPDMSPDEERWRLLNAINEFLRAISQRRPVLLVLEDLHWADRGTLDALLHLVRNLEGARVLIVGTYRDMEVDRAHPLAAVLAELRRAGSFLRIHLTGLDAGEVHRLYEAIRGNEVPRPQAELVHRQTEGNPLFVLEVLRFLVEEGFVVRDGGRYVYTSDRTPDSLLPEGLKDVLGRRLSRLSDQTNQMLSLAAVIGREFSFDVLRQVASFSEDELESALAEAVSRAIIEEHADVGAPISYRFTHALIRQTLYDEIIAPRRNRWHVQVGRAIEELHSRQLEAHAIELAEHFSNASSPEELRKAVHYGELAAENALFVYAYADAAALLERCLAVQELLDPDDAAQRGRLLLALGEALIGAGDAARVLSDVAGLALAAAESLNDAELASQACRLAIHALHASKGWGGWDSPEVAEWAKAAARYATPGTPCGSTVLLPASPGRMHESRLPAGTSADCPGPG